MWVTITHIEQEVQKQWEKGMWVTITHIGQEVQKQWKRGCG